MSDELKPCPCCGSTRMETTENVNESNNMGRCGAVWCECGLHMSARSLEEAMARWNARASVTDEQFSMAVHDGRAWQVVRECRIEWRGQVIETEHSIECDGEYYCTACGDALPKWADGAWDDYQAAHFAGEPPFRCCPNCGAKVTEPPERTCCMNRVLLYDEEGIECDECGWEDVHSWDEPMPERCPGCNRKVVAE